jgi:hypothetical protein
MLLSVAAVAVPLASHIVELTFQTADIAPQHDLGVESDELTDDVHDEW